MKHDVTLDLFNYWNELRGERAAPERSEIDPTAIRNILADTFMLDVDLSRRFPFRLAGTRVNALFDREQKGRSFLEIWRRDERRNISAILLTVADGVRPVVAGAVADVAGQGEQAMEFLFLPLRHHGRTHSRMLGLMKPMSRAAWLGSLPIGLVSLRSLRVIDTDECEAYRPMRKIAVGQTITPVYHAEPDFQPAHRPGRPLLRVIEGGR